jgi:hypothetical protein
MVSGNSIVLRLEGLRCADGSQTSCKPEGNVLSVCKVPPLRVGDYSLDFGGKRKVPFRVTEDGTQTACGIPSNVRVNAAGLSTACETDDDCTTVFEGDACSACQCGGKGIAKSALATYQERYAEQRRKCAQGGDETPCKCPVTGATCKAKVCTSGS